MGKGQRWKSVRISCIFARSLLLINPETQMPVFFFLSNAYYTLFPSLSFCEAFSAAHQALPLRLSPPDLAVTAFNAVASSAVICFLVMCQCAREVE